jgi:hypothetical protein
MIRANNTMRFLEIKCIKNLLRVQLGLPVPSGADHTGSAEFAASNHNSAARAIKDNSNQRFLEINCI